MSAVVNVNRGLTDQFYRYKMPKILAKVEGKGNGIKTVIVNMVEVAKALNRPPMYPTKYFGCILGAQVQYDSKNERYIVNGSHESGKLQDLLDGFIQKYVLCTNCNNPETDLGVLQKRQIITTKCKACGYSATLNNKDKLATFIIKNPPNNNQVASGSQVNEKASKKNKKREKDGKTTGKQINGDTGKKDDSDEVNENENNTNQDSRDVDDEDDDVDWGEDTDADAVAKRMEELSLGAKGLMLNSDMEKTAEERSAIFLEYVKGLNDTNTGNFNPEVQKKIVAEAERLDIKDKAVLVLCEVLFDENIVQQIRQHRLLFLRFTAGNPKAQKYLLRGFELVVKLYREALMKRVPIILKVFYDSDILEEKVLLDWGTKINHKNVGKELADEIHTAAENFINWLQTAEEETESDSDDEDLEVVYDDKVRGGEIEVEQEKKPAAVSELAAAPLKEEIDIDIDAI